MSQDIFLPQILESTSQKNLSQNHKIQFSNDQNKKKKKGKIMRKKNSSSGVKGGIIVIISIILAGIVYFREILLKLFESVTN